MGAAQGEFNQLAADLSGQYGSRARLHFEYDEPLSHLIYAAADILLVPSMFEPCGLTQMIAMRWPPPPSYVPCLPDITSTRPASYGTRTCDRTCRDAEPLRGRGQAQPKQGVGVTRPRSQSGDARMNCEQSDSVKQACARMPTNGSD